MTTMRDVPGTTGMARGADGTGAAAPAGVSDQPGRREVELGFMFDHSLMSATARQALDAASRALVVEELLVERGLIDAAEVAERRPAAEARLEEQVATEGPGLFVNDHDVDKYTIEEPGGIDCAARIPLCKAACCRLRFPLSRQDVEGGVVRWDFGRPYWNQVDDSGYCVHNDSETRTCGVYSERPAPCRAFDCRDDARIWVDFDARIPNPDLASIPAPGVPRQSAAGPSAAPLRPNG